MNQITNILLAADDSDDYLFLVEALQNISPDYKIQRAANGDECILTLKKKAKPDLIFPDLNITFRNGLECLTDSKGNKRLSKVPVVIYSTGHYIKDIETAYTNGADYYIVKPRSADGHEELLNVVDSNLNEVKTG